MEGHGGDGERGGGVRPEWKAAGAVDVLWVLDEEVGMGWLVVDEEVAGAVLDPGPDCEGVPPDGEDEVLPMLGQRMLRCPINLWSMYCYDGWNRLWKGWSDVM